LIYNLYWNTLAALCAGYIETDDGQASPSLGVIVEDEAALLECKAAIVDNISRYESGWMRYFFKHNKNYTDYKELFDILINPNSLY